MVYYIFKINLGLKHMINELTMYFITCRGVKNLFKNLKFGMGVP